MKRALLLALFILPTITASAATLDSLKLLYIGDKGTPREQAFTTFLRKHATTVDAVDRHNFDPKTAAPYDVVLLDWPQNAETRDMHKLIAPLGQREAWHRPTVLLGSAGLNLAVAWQMKGGTGCTCMDPLAYGLRDHEIFDKPIKIERKFVTIPTPVDFQDEIKDPTVQVIPLVNDIAARWKAGWCTYSFDFADNPDVEYFCGGVNHKTPTAAGLWRQGNFLHFGFEQSPAETNATGQNLLLNSIAYISRFTQDRPIARTPSVFAGKIAPSRKAVIRRLENPRYPLDWTKDALAPDLWKQLPNQSLEALITWAQANAKFLHPNPDKQLELDPDLQAINTPFDQPEFFDQLQRLFQGAPEQQAQAKRLADRYLPDLQTPTAQALETWLKKNRPYLFPSDSSDYRWYIDPLAKARTQPTATLRGLSRADRPG
ncbi:MAG: hypothetical protein JWN40_1822 [Phycisphaerales bacterium]|nr:hypothetical protein [Phycisphaerales bacterium]